MTTFSIDDIRNIVLNKDNLLSQNYIAREAMNDILGQEISLETRYRIAKALEHMNKLEKMRVEIGLTK